MPITNIIDPEKSGTEADKGRHVKDGFQDPSGTLPFVEYLNHSDLNFRAQGDVTDKIVSRTNRAARTESTTSQVTKRVAAEPEIPNQSIYPHNRVIKTSAGHIIELDNTPGHERIMIKHRTGTKLEMRPNGSVKFIAHKDRYTAIAGDEELVVRGNTTIVLESDASVRVEGDLELQVEGDMKALVQGNYNLEVEGDYTERVHGDKSSTITGTYLRDIRGNVTERNLSDFLDWTVGEHVTNVGGLVELTTESTLKIVSDDKVSMECEGGFIDIGGGDVQMSLSGITGTFLSAANINLSQLSQVQSLLSGNLNVSSAISGALSSAISSGLSGALSSTLGELVNVKLGSTIINQIMISGIPSVSELKGKLIDKALGVLGGVLPTYTLEGVISGATATITGVVADTLGTSRVVCGAVYAGDYHAEQNYYGKEFHGEDGFYGGDVHGEAGFFTDLDVEEVIEGEAKKATYADTAGAAPDGAAVSTTPAPEAPEAADEADDTPTSNLEAVSVADESDGYISDIDRSTYYDNKYNKRKLNTYEVWARINNANLRYDPTWMQDQVDYGAIKDTATLGFGGQAKRTFSLNNDKLGIGVHVLGNKRMTERGFKLDVPKKLLVDVIPEQFKIETATRATRLSPYFTMGNMLGGDNNTGQLIEQGGLSKEDIAKNCQLVAFNVLEEFREHYQDRWTIAHGVYNLLDQEMLAPDSINMAFLQGLAVGIQFDEEDKGIYYDAAVWASKNLVFDKIILSYISYDPADINEPTLIISIKNGNNSKTLETHFNNEVVGSELQDMSD